MTKKLVLSYLESFPEMKDYTLAKKMWQENKDIFTNLEHARERIRYHRGHHGKHNRSKLKNTELITPLNYDTNNSQKEAISYSKILILDIETAPIRAYVWGIWNQNVSTNQIQSDWFCLTWAAKWLFEDKVYSARLRANEVQKQDDKRIIQGIWNLLNEADIVIAHNGEKFDIPKLNSRFIINGLNPPLAYQQIDTLKHIRRQFGFTSNKLDYVNKLLNLERKTDTGGFELWERCMIGDDEALREMEMYNINDVRILEETYLHIRAWIKPHPNIALFILDETQERCPSCGSDQLNDIGKLYYTTSNAYELRRCKNCGSTARKRLSSVHLKQRRHLILSTPK